MAKLDEFANTVANEVYIDEDNKSFDIITILMITSLAIQIGKMIYECVKERRNEVIKNPNPLQRVTFRLMVMRQVGVLDFAKIRGNKLVSSMMAQAAALSDEDLAALLTEIDNAVI